MKNSKKLIVIAVLAAIICTAAGCQKKSEPAAPPAADANAAAVVIEQTICPVMGGKINKDVFVEYQGKKVYFCCPECKGKFEKEPEKYLGQPRCYLWTVGHTQLVGRTERIVEKNRK